LSVKNIDNNVIIDDAYEWGGDSRNQSENCK